MPLPRLPLEGVRIVDLTTVVSGPYATLLLADLGADVVKIEAPAGDIARHLGPCVNRGMGAVYLNCNRNKRSVVLDLATDDGRRALKALTGRADVFVTNMRPDALAKCGADAETLRADHPELVHCSVRGFGSDGPYADLPAYDDIAQAVSGLAAQQEWMAGEPQYVASAVGDKVSGLTAAFAIVAALHGRTTTGVGATVEVPMAETLTAFGLVEHLWGRVFDPPRGEARYPRMSSP
ncbi:MAG TPA: CoA transferase, partial [Acidimicrobiia bacterium]|nr:CoA transferase [Acidimicrobiia bacterium]